MRLTPSHVTRRLRERVAHTWRSHPELARRVLPWTERLHSVRARLHPRRPARPLERIVFEFAQAVPDAAFVQVGAHDGTQLDPLREAILGSRWHGIMVEPVPYVFDRLKSRYHTNPRVILENVAVAEQNGSRDLHFLAQADGDDDVWQWYDALGSFKREVVLSHAKLVSDIEERLVSVEVPCVTFSTLCERNSLDHVDLVQIDTEGYDREILELIDFQRFGTDIVIFEHLHLDHSARTSCRTLLAGAGFEQLSDGMDTIAVTSRALAIPGVATAFAEARTALAGFEQ